VGLRIITGIHKDNLFGRQIWGKNLEQSLKVHETESAGGACFIIKRSVIGQIGFLDEGYSPAYFEDVDYCLKARRARFRLAHDGAVSIIHYGSATKKRIPANGISFSYRRNLVRFIAKHLPMDARPGHDRPRSRFHPEFLDQ